MGRKTGSYMDKPGHWKPCHVESKVKDHHSVLGTHHTATVRDGKTGQIKRDVTVAIRKK